MSAVELFLGLLCMLFVGIARVAYGLPRAMLWLVTGGAWVTLAALAVVVVAS